jgi:hypothetical protein
MPSPSLRAAALLLVAVTVLQGQTPAKASAAGKGCTTVQQAFGGQKRPVCLLWKWSGREARPSPDIRVHYRHITVKWSYRCPATVPVPHIVIILDESKGILFKGGKEIFNGKIVFEEGKLAASGQTRVYIGGGDHISLWVNVMGRNTSRTGQCSWRAIVTGDNY